MKQVSNLWKKEDNHSKLKNFYKMNTRIAPEYLSEHIPAQISDDNNHILRDRYNLQAMNHMTQRHAHSFLPRGIEVWNALLEDFSNSLVKRI